MINLIATHTLILCLYYIMTNILKRITNWEAWPFKLLYAPLVPFWLMYILRARSVWFFTPSNPKITFGGMEGEPKKEMYDLLPNGLYPETIYVEPGISEEKLLNMLNESGIEYPFIVKPDNGGQGILFRKIDQQQQLLQYHRLVPDTYIVQALIKHPMEVSVFYIRHPNRMQGKITGFLHKVPLHVIGDGKSTVGQLIIHHPKASKRIEELKLKHGINWGKIINRGEIYPLSFAANHNRGAKFYDLKDKVDNDLVSVFDKISHQVDDFFYGRYDILCNSVEDLKQGKNFQIIEFNGCGAEPNHFYDTGYSLFGAYREILKHWKALFEISMYNRKQRKIEPWNYRKGRSFLDDANKRIALMREIDKQIL